MALPSSQQDMMTWGTMLQHESEHISRQAKQLFRRAKAAFGSGHTVSGISGNDKALACLCLCLTKIKLVTCDRKAVETSLQRTSGVRARIFSTALKELPKILLSMALNEPPKILQATNANPSPQRKSPIKQPELREDESRSATHIVGGSVSKGKEVMKTVAQDLRDQLIKSSSLKRPPALRDLGDGDDELLLSPSSKKRIRISEKLSPSRTEAETPRPIFERPSNTRTIHKTPLNLPIQKPAKPLCIFQSHPLINPKKLVKPRLDFTDWNWKSDLFSHHWSLNDIREWEKWNKKSMDTCLS